MDVTFDQVELFPVVEEKLGKVSAWRRLRDAMNEHGPLLPRATIPIVVDLSRQRVHQLIEERRLQTITVNDREWVPIAALEAFLTEERKNGRPVKEHTLSGRMSELVRHGKIKS